MNDWLAIAGLLTLFVFLAILGRMIQGQFFKISLLLTRRTGFGIRLYSLVFLPGIILHELSHFLTAAFLGVRTGKITIFPEEIVEGRVRLGSVQVEKTDFLRSSIIGGAPLITGGLALFFLARALDGFSFELMDFLFLYLMLAVGNTLFTSREDARHWPVLAVFLALIFLVLGIVGFLEESLIFVNDLFSGLSVGLTRALILAVSVDLLLLLILRIVVGTTRRAVGRSSIFKE